MVQTRPVALSGLSGAAHSLIRMTPERAGGRAATIDEAPARSRVPPSNDFWGMQGRVR